MEQRDDDEALALAVQESPRLLALASSIDLADDLIPAVVALTRRFSGQPVSDPGTFGQILFVVADRELRVIEAVCGGDLTRATVAAFAWIEQVLVNLGGSADGASPPVRETSFMPAEGFGEDVAQGPDPDPTDPELEAEFRAQLSALIQREVPANFPLPPAVQAAPAGGRDPTVAGAILSQALSLTEVTQAAAERALSVDEAVLALGGLLPGFGWDYSTGVLQRSLAFDIHRLGALLARLPVLRRIAEELGRMEAIERQRRRAAGGGRESVVGVRVGGELADVLPSELALLGVEETEDLFYQRFTEHRLFCLELQGTISETSTSDQHRGPAVACVDTSGSMQGAPEAVAKALILAVVRQLAPQGRPVQLLLFGGPGESNALELRAGRGGLEGLLRFLSMGFHSGTDYDTPLLRAAELLGTETYSKADVLVVTDGLCRASARMVEKVAAAKKQASARILSVVIGRHAGGVEAFSDDVWLIKDDAPVECGFDFEHWRRGSA